MHFSLSVWTSGNSWYTFIYTWVLTWKNHILLDRLATWSAESGRFGFSRSTPLIARQHPLTRYYRLATDAVSRFNGCPALKTRNSNFFFTSLLRLYTPLLPRWGEGFKEKRGGVKTFLEKWHRDWAVNPWFSILNSVTPFYFRE